MSSSFERILDNFPDLVSLHYRDSKFKYTSETFARQLGYIPGELIGQSALALIHPEDRNRVNVKGFRLVEEGMAPITIEYRLRRRDGNYIWIQSKMNYFRFGEHDCVLNSARELHTIREKEIEIAESEVSLSEAEEMAGMGSWRVNIKTFKNWWSKGNFWLYGLEPMETPPPVLGYIVKQALHPDDGQLVLEAIQRVKETEKPQELHVRIRAANDPHNYKHLITKIRPVYVDGKLIEVKGTNLDVTKLVKVQKELERRNYNLSQLNERLANYAFKNAHDLRGPLSTLMGVISLMKEETPKSEYMSYLEESSRNLDKVVQEINTILTGSDSLEKNTEPPVV